MFKFLGVSFACFNRTQPQQQEAGRDTSSTDLEAGSLRTLKKNCIFCAASEDNGFKIVYEDASCLAFQDKNPASAVHCLVVPKIHIGNVRRLRSNDVELVRRMEHIGHLVLDKFNVPMDQRRMGFHIPPFYSIDHLHLHIQGLPYNSRLKALKYHVSPQGYRSSSHSKGLSWFAEVGQTIRILERGGTVGLLPC